MLVLCITVSEHSGFWSSKWFSSLLFEMWPGFLTDRSFVRMRRENHWHVEALVLGKPWAYLGGQVSGEYGRVTERNREGAIWKSNWNRLLTNPSKFELLFCHYTKWNLRKLLWLLGLPQFIFRCKIHFSHFLMRWWKMLSRGRVEDTHSNITYSHSPVCFLMLLLNLYLTRD